MLKSGGVVGIFSKARVEEDRFVFELSHGIDLEASQKGIREIFNLGRAELCGLIAADRSISKYQEKEGKSTIYKTYLKTNDQELAEIFDKLFEETYRITPHHYIGYHKARGEKRQHYDEVVYSKKVA
ncbi:MAG: hypothetical protein QW797_02005 [Thermoproteota archaeon]